MILVAIPATVEVVLSTVVQHVLSVVFRNKLSKRLGCVHAMQPQAVHCCL